MAVSDLPVMNGVGLHDVEQGLLPEAVLLLEELVFRVGSSDVSAYDLRTTKVRNYTNLLQMF